MRSLFSPRPQRGGAQPRRNAGGFYDVGGKGDDRRRDEGGNRYERNYDRRDGSSYDRRSGRQYDRRDNRSDWNSQRGAPRAGREGSPRMHSDRTPEHSPKAISEQELPTEKPFSVSDCTYRSMSSPNATFLLVTARSLSLSLSLSLCVCVPFSMVILSLCMCVCPLLDGDSWHHSHRFSVATCRWFQIKKSWWGISSQGSRCACTCPSVHLLYVFADRTRLQIVEVRAIRNKNFSYVDFETRVGALPPSDDAFWRTGIHSRTHVHRRILRQHLQRNRCLAASALKSIWTWAGERNRRTLISHVSTHTYALATIYIARISTHTTTPWRCRPPEQREQNDGPARERPKVAHSTFNDPHRPCAHLIAGLAPRSEYVIKLVCVLV